jgi:hypothetical protein
MSKKIVREVLMAKIAAGEKLLKAFTDEDFKQVSDAAKAEEKAIATKSTGVDVGVADQGQNAKANDNWPVGGRMETAAKLVQVATEHAKTASSMMAIARGLVMAGGDPITEEVKEAAADGGEDLETKIASRLVKIAGEIISEEDDKTTCDCDEGNKEVAAALITLAKSLSK